MPCLRARRHKRTSNKSLALEKSAMQML